MLKKLVVFSVSAVLLAVILYMLAFSAPNTEADMGAITGYATLTGSCTVVPADECTGDDKVCLGRALATTNTHLAIPDTIAYPYCVCCTGTDLTNTCSGTYAVFTSLLAIENSHAAVPGTAGYDVDLCLGVTSGTVSCQSNQGSCPAGTTCALKLSNTENAHAEACDDFTNNYQTYLCCAVTEEEEQCIDGEGSECTREGLACCDIGEEPNLDPAHCSFGLYNDLGTGHCCRNGEYWDDEFNQCRGTEQCGYDIDPCRIDPAQDYVGWAQEPNCVNPQQRVACCPNVDWYGEPGNYPVPIHIYTGPE